MADKNEMLEKEQLESYYRYYNNTMQGEVADFLTELNGKAEFNLDQASLDNLSGLLNEVSLPANIKDSLNAKIQARTVQLQKEEIYNAFNQLLNESESHLSKGEADRISPAIKAYAARKEEYLKAHPEEEAGLNAYIDSTLSQKDDEDQFTTSDYFRMTYGQEDKQFTAWLTNRDNQKDKEDLFKAFDALVAESEGRITSQKPEEVKPLINDFVKRKDEYLKAHPEAAKDVNTYIDSALAHHEADEQFTISEYFRIAYAEGDRQFTAWMTNANGNTQDDNTNQGPADGNGGDGLPKGFNPVGMTFDLGDNNNGNGGNNNGGKTGSGEKEPLTVLPGGNGNGGHGNDDDHTTDQEITEEYRKLSMNGDENDAMMDLLRISALKDMNKIKDVDIDALSEQDAINLLHEALPKLSDKELKEMESRVTDRILTADPNTQQAELLGMVPPLVLAEKYEKLSDIVNKTKTGQEHDEALDKLNKIGGRIDELASQLITKKTNRDLWFNDYTNIADIHYGYEKMFAAREKDLIELAKEGNQSADQRVGIMRDGMKLLNEEVAKYDERMNLSGVTKDSADDLNKRFDDIKPRIDSVEISPEVLELASRYKFRDENGNIEPQFELPDGSRSDTYAQGAKIIEGSKLDTMVKMAKQDVLLESLGADEKNLTDENLKKEVNDQLPFKLFEIDAMGKGLKLAENLSVDGPVMEKDQFTNADHFAKFLNELRQEPKTCSNAVYEIARDRMVEKNRAFTQRVAQKIESREHPVLFKVMDSVKDFDKRAADRSTNGKLSRKEIWKSIGKRALIGGGIAFATSFALSTGAAALATDAGLTAATLGANKFAGAILGTALGVGAMALHVKQWRKSQKEQGKPAGFKAFFKNPQNLMSVATSALGGLATGALLTGNPGVAMTLGYGALAVGAVNGVTTNYVQIKRSGGNNFDAIAGGLLVGGATIGGGFLGREASHLAINLFNKFMPDNHIFQDKHVTRTHVQDAKDEFVFHDKDAVVKGSQDTLDHFYKGNEAQMKADLADIKEFYKAHGIDFPEERALVMLNDGGTNTNTDTVNYTPHGNVHTHGNNLVMTHGWADSKGLDHSIVDALNIPRGPDGHLMMNMDAHNAIMKVNPFVSAHNEIGYCPNTETFNTHVLPDNAVRGADGIPVRSENGNEYGTYINHDGVGEWKHTPGIDSVKTTTVHHYGNLVGTFGMFFKPLGKKMFKMGSALADMIVGKKTSPVVTPPTETTPPKKPDVPPKVVIKIPEEQNYLIEEYWMIHGYNPAVRDMKDKDGKTLKDKDGHIQKMEINPMLDAGYKAYVQKVEAERVAAGGKPMLEFLQKRRADMDKVIENHTSAYLGGHNAKLNVDILDPVGYEQVNRKQQELRSEGKKPMTKDEINSAIKLPTPEELKDNFKAHRPTSKLCKIIRDAFWRKDNGVEVNNPKQRSTVEMDGKKVEANKVVFSFNDFIKSAENTLVRTTKETERDATKAPVRRLDEAGKMKRTKESQR